MSVALRWSIILSFAAVAASTQMLWVTFAPITTQTATLLHVSEGAVGWLSEVFPLIYVLLAIPCGIWTDRWFRGSLAIGAILTAIGAVLRLIEPNYVILLGAQIVISIGQPLVLNAINKIAAAYIPEEKRTLAIAIGSSSFFFGILLAMFSGPLLIRPVSLEPLMWAQAGFTLLSVILLVSLLRFRPTYIDKGYGQAPLRAVWRHPFIRRLSILLFIGFGLFIAITTWLQALLSGTGVSSVEVGLALALMTAAGMVGAVLLPDWAIRTNKARAVTLVSLIFMGITLLAILNGHPFWMIALLLALTGFLILSVLPIVLSIAEKHFPEDQVGTVTGLLLLAGNGGGIALAMIVQVFIGNPLVSILILFAATLLALPAAIRFPTVHVKNDEQAGDDSSPLFNQ